MPSTAHAATGSAIPLTSCRPRLRRRNKSPIVTCERFGPRRKLRRCGRGSGKLGNRPKQSPAISKKHDAKLVLEVIVREVLKDRKLDPLFDKPVRIFGETEGRKPVSDRRHFAMRPIARN